MDNQICPDFPKNELNGADENLNAVKPGYEFLITEYSQFSLSAEEISSCDLKQETLDFTECESADLVIVGLQEIVALSTTNVISSTITTQYSLQSERVEVTGVLLI